jgi:hypothetical protein
MQRTSFYATLSKFLFIGVLFLLVACEIDLLSTLWALHRVSHVRAGQLLTPLTCLAPAMASFGFRRILQDYSRRGQISPDLAGEVTTWVYTAIGLSYLQILDLISRLHPSR